MFRDSCLRNAITLSFLANNNSEEVKRQKPDKSQLRIKMDALPLNTLSPWASIQFLHLCPLCSTLPAILIWLNVHSLLLGCDLSCPAVGHVPLL